MAHLSFTWRVYDFTQSAVMIAARRGNAQCIKVLAEAGADVNKIHPDERTVQLQAARSRVPLTLVR